jgi:hypothetical protein
MDNDLHLAQQIAKLQGTVDEGFRGIHARQDITNGRVGKCENRLTYLEQTGYRQDGERHAQEAVAKKFKQWWGVIATIISIAVALYATLKK